MRTATGAAGQRGAAEGISILAVLADRDRPHPGVRQLPTFQSSRSLRTATMSSSQVRAARVTFQSSRSLRTATHFSELPGDGVAISILAVLADRDLAIPAPAPAHEDISILAVLADRDAAFRPGAQSTRIFQSSRSLRTATAVSWSPVISRDIFQSSRSLRTATCGARRSRPGSPPYFNPRGPCGPRQ